MLLVSPALILLLLTNTISIFFFFLHQQIRMHICAACYLQNLINLFHFIYCLYLYLSPLVSSKAMLLLASSSLYCSKKKKKGSVVLFRFAHVQWPVCVCVCFFFITMTCVTSKSCVVQCPLGRVVFFFLCLGVLWYITGDWAVCCEKDEQNLRSGFQFSSWLTIWWEQALFWVNLIMTLLAMIFS